MWILWLAIGILAGLIIISALFLLPDTNNYRVGENRICRYCGSIVDFYIKENGDLIIWCNNCNKETYTIEDNRMG